MLVMSEVSQDSTPLKLRNSFSILLCTSLEFKFGIEMMAWVTFWDEVLLDIRNTEINSMKMIPNKCFKSVLQDTIARFPATQFYELYLVIAN